LLLCRVAAYTGRPEVTMRKIDDSDLESWESFKFIGQVILLPIVFFGSIILLILQLLG
jgi:hypothetical protein